MLAAYLLGVPFLIWKIKQVRDGLAAQLLLGVLAFVPMLTFIPFTATPISNVIGPWILYRLTWPLLLAALLTLGWMCWEALRFAGSGLGGFDSTRRVAPFLPLIVVGILLVEAVAPALTALRAAEDPAEIAQDESTCLDPTFRWMQGAIPASSSIMAPRTENPCIMAYTASANVVGVRGQISSQFNQDLQNFYAAPTLGPEALEILERREVGYVFLPANSPLNAQLEHLPGFARMNNPGERYRVYEVTDPQRAFETTPAIAANGELKDEEWDAAIEAYTEVLEDNPNEDERFLAYLGLGRAYVQQEEYAEATENYQAAAELDPYSPAPYDLLATAHNAAGERDQARAAFERATELDPGNAALRLRYGQFLLPLDRREAVEQHLAVTRTFPRVPEYRVRLGAVLAIAGDTEAADRELERAIYLSPLSAKIRADVAGANLASGHPLSAIEHYEEALELSPNSQLYTLNLGKIHAQLSTLNGRDEERFEEAEALLGSVEELGHPPWEADQREAARISLGDLYLAWDRPEEAAAAYERALQLNPDSREAREKLAGLPR
jgi:tetratricopeptide (TPR) repeat protein